MKKPVFHVPRVDHNYVTLHRGWRRPGYSRLYRMIYFNLLWD